jgi:hypothetical protein
MATTGAEEAFGEPGYPDILQAGRQARETGNGGQKSGSVHRQADAHLRSGNAVMRYYVNASDGDIGHVEGLLVDERSWAIRYVIVNTSNWWMGHKVLIAAQWIAYVSWAESKIDVNLCRQAIMDSPPYDAAMPLTPEHEAEIHAHYGRVDHRPPGALETETDSRT